MIRNSSMIVAASALLLFAACDKKENSYDFAQILAPAGGMSVTYADATADTLRFATTYDWSLTIQGDWLSVASDSLQGAVPKGYYKVERVNVHLDANRTGQDRTGYIFFNADGKQLQAIFVQRGYLNVLRPARESDSYLLPDSATQKSDSIVFTTYADGWTLSWQGEQQPDWVAVDAESPLTGRRGTHVAHVVLQPNTTEVERRATLLLESAGVKAPIVISQATAH